MIKKFKNNPYVRASVAVIICGAILIIFSDWISKNQIAIGFEVVNKTLTPVYIGIIFAFMLCPVYNACVKFIYGKMMEGTKKKAFGFGTKIISGEGEDREVAADEKHSIFTFARAISTIICVVLVVGLAGLLAYFVLPQLVQSIFGLVDSLPQQSQSLSEWADSHSAGSPHLAESINNFANVGSKDVMSWLEEHLLNGKAVNIATAISSGVFNAVKMVVNIVLGLLIMVYLLNYKERLFAMIRKFIAATCGQKRQDSLFEFAAIVNETFIGFIVGRIIDSFIIGVLTYIVMSLMGLEFALMISVIIGVTNIIPFFGPFIGAIPSALLLLLENPVHAFYFLIIILLIQQLDGNVIGPKIVGNAIGISSFWVLIAVLVGGGMFGFAGMALGVPVLAVIGTYADKLTTKSLIRKDRPSATDDYFNLDSYDIYDEDVMKEPEKKDKKSMFDFVKKRKKDKKHE